MKLLAAIGLVVVLLHFTGDGNLTGKLCFDGTCIGALHGGIHLGDRGEWSDTVAPVRQT